MSASQRCYQPEPTYGGDYTKIRSFLIRLDHYNYPFGRWDWMVSHPYLDKSGLSKIGLWEENDSLVGLATYDCKLGSAYLLNLPRYEYLMDEMLTYARERLSKDGQFRVMIPDGNRLMQDVAARQGLRPTQGKECDAILPIGSTYLSYTLPEGFQIVSMKDRFDLYQYGKVLWNGFNHEVNGEGPYTHNSEESLLAEFHRPNVNLELKIAVVAPNGDFVSYCGMWQDPATQSALVEPVATDPAYRKMGLGKAAVLEAVKRCGQLGAKRAFVGSSQQFYYSIGFRPFATSTWWA